MREWPETAVESCGWSESGRKGFQGHRGRVGASCVRLVMTGESARQSGAGERCVEVEGDRSEDWKREDLNWRDWRGRSGGEGGSSSLEEGRKDKGQCRLFDFFRPKRGSSEPTKVRPILQEGRKRREQVSKVD